MMRGSTLLKAVVREGLPIGRSCRGVGVCAGCRVRVVAGGENLDGKGELERVLEARAPLREGERYACLAHVRGDVAITTSYW